jgi:hypothetical protein
MNNIQYNLEWSDLKPIQDIDLSNEDQGVYVWGFKFDSEFIPYYVGIAFNVQTRLLEHVNNIVGGKYCIIHSNDLREFRKYKDCETVSINKGLLYIPNWPNGYLSFLKRRNSLQPHIDNMVSKMHFSFASLNKHTTMTKKDLEDIEKYCINCIGKDNLWNTRGGTSNLSNVTHSGNLEIKSLFEKKNSN